LAAGFCVMRVVVDGTVDDVYAAVGCGVRAKGPEVAVAAKSKHLGTS